MKRVFIAIFAFLAMCGILEAKGGIDPKKALYGTGKIFVGPEIGIGSAWFQDFSMGVTAGYQYYFKDAWQFAGFRHGVRGYGNLAYVYDYDNRYIGLDSYKGGPLRNYGYQVFNNNGFHLRAGADWTLEFNPLDNVIWGVYTGFSLGWIQIFNDSKFKDYGDYWLYDYNRSTFGVAWHIGGSVNIANQHRVDVGFEGGYFSILSVRYLYMF